MTVGAFTLEMGVALAILLLSYGLIFSEVIHRSYAALLGAVAMVVIGQWAGFYGQGEAMEALDANTLLLLMATMLLVAMLRPTGAFEYLGIRLAKLAAGDPRRLLVYLCIAVSVLSMILDNVTTVIIFAPLTVLVTRMLQLNPAPFLIGEAMMSNIGGAATLVGDPPNIMIGSAADIDFLHFLINMGPLVLPVWLVTLALLVWSFRGELQRLDMSAIVDMDETQAIRRPVDMWRMVTILSAVVLLFFLHDVLHWYPALVAILGLAVALAWLRPEPEAIMNKVEWTVLLFFASLFILVGGLDASGFLQMLGGMIADYAREPGRLLATALLLMWVSALLSAVIDNIPFTVTMLPIITALETQGVETAPLWWALALGVGLGGNGTHIGATANLIAVTEAERSQMPEAVISPVRWLRVGLPVLACGLVAGSGVFALMFPLFL